MDGQSRNIKSEEYWRAHVERLKSSTGTVDDYCQENGLSKATFNRYRRQFGAVKRRKQRGAFVKVTPLFPVETTVKSKRSPLPDPRWVAELLIALGGGER